MPVSAMRTETLTAGDTAVISEGPCVVTSVIVTEIQGGAATAVTLSATSDMTLLMQLNAAAGQTVVWAGEAVAAGGGVTVACLEGDATVSVAHR